MKKVILALFLAITLLLCGCGESVVATDVSLSDIQSELVALLQEENPIVLNKSYIFSYYGITPDEYAEAAVCMITRPVFPSELVMFKATDEETAAQIQAALEIRLQSLREQSRDYDAESNRLAESAEIYAKGLYRALFFDAKQEELQKLFSTHLKDYAPAEAPVYTPAPTPEPTPEPTPTAEALSEEVEKLPYRLVPERERVPDSWFDDVLFIGNSVGKNLETYVTKQRLGENSTCMGKATFFTAGRYCFRNAVENSYHRPTYQGEYRTPAEVIELTGAKKVYIALSQIDIIFQNRTFEETIAYADTLFKTLREAFPEVDIYVCGVSPRLNVFEGSDVDSKTIPVFNEMLLNCAVENDCYFIDCFTPLADENNFLRLEYSSEYNDGGIHLTDKGCQVWLDWLYTHTAP